jgi:ribosomal protein S18 acetylase RimI-like enzyme
MGRQEGLSIVHARKMHLDQICALERQIFADDDQFSRSRLRYLLSSRNAAFFLGLKDGQPIAYGIALKNRLVNGKVKGRIYSLGVVREHRHRGIGSRLLNALEQWLVAAGASFITLETKATKGGAKHFFKERGYRVTEFLAEYYSSLDGLRMRKPRTPVSRIQAVRQPSYREQV